MLGDTRLSRSFSEGLNEFSAAHGYGGDPADVSAKIAFLRDAFARTGIKPPREMEKWYTAHQPIRRETIFQLCFTFELDGSDMDEFFR